MCFYLSVYPHHYHHHYHLEEGFLSSEHNLVEDQGLLEECQGLPGRRVMRCRGEGQGCLVLGEGRVMGYLGRECQGLPRGSQGCLSLGFLVCMPKPVSLSL